ncbi:MAG: hypothetical protein ACOC0C_04485 [Bacteroidota bacterium]
MNNYKWIKSILAIFVVLTSCNKTPELIKIGQLKTRNSTEIESSMWSVGAETIDREYSIYANWKEHLAPLGVKRARIQSGWARTEKEKGVYSWGWQDSVVYDMHEKKIKPWMNFSFGNPLYTTYKGDPVRGDIPKTPEAKRAWGEFVKANVERYKDIIDEWEIWNEPAFYKKITPEEYVDLVVQTGDTIRSIQPDAKLFLFSMGHGTLKEQLADTCIDPDDPCNYPSMVLDILKERNRMDLVDAITIHPYEYNPDEVTNVYHEFEEFLSKYSNEILIVQGECGAPSSENKKRALANYPWTERSQAKWALRRMLGDWAYGVYFSSYFGMIDMKYPEEVNEKGLIAINPDKTVHHLKEGYYAVQNLTAIFDDNIRKIDGFQYEIIDGGRDDITCHAFLHANSNKGGIVIWEHDSIPADDNQKEIINLEIEKLSFSDPVLVDLRTGEVFDFSPFLSKNEKGNLLSSLPVYDSPLLVVDRSIINIKLD